MSTVTREAFEARIEAVEARVDARVAGAIARMDATDLRIDERFKWLTAVFAERDKRLDERDKRIEQLASRAATAAENASNLRTHMWLAASTVIIAVIGTVIGTVIGAYYATQSSHLAMAQTVIAAFQQGQQIQTLLKAIGSRRLPPSRHRSQIKNPRQPKLTRVF
jgi:3-oxoacyl-(acyl-carrier-protein) synthase